MDTILPCLNKKENSSYEQNAFHICKKYQYICIKKHDLDRSKLRGGVLMGLQYKRGAIA
jgi:hypothetical protein